MKRHDVREGRQEAGKSAEPESVPSRNGGATVAPRSDIEEGSARVAGGPIVLGPLRIEPDEFIATLNGRRLKLTYKEFKLLLLFAQHRGHLLRRQEIAAEVWGDHAPGRTIDIHVSRLRKNLPPGAIETVINVGYRFTLG